MYGAVCYVDDRAALLQLRHAVYIAALELRYDYHAAARRSVSLVRHPAGHPLEDGGGTRAAKCTRCSTSPMTGKIVIEWREEK